MPPTSRKTPAKPTGPAAGTEVPSDKPAQAAAKGDTEVFTYEQLVSVKTNPDAAPGPDTAAELAAIQAGWRPTGAPTVERTEANERDQTVLVVWSVPVRRA
jgi:hypothetical protein